MRTRLSRRRQIQKAKGDLLDQKWLTYFLVIILVLLIVTFVVLSSPAYKKQFIESVKTVFYGKKQKARCPQASPAAFQGPTLIGR